LLQFGDTELMQTGAAGEFPLGESWPPRAPFQLQSESNTPHL